MTEKRKSPALRFRGYTDDWEQRKFSELYARSSEKNDGSIGMDKNITVATMQFKNDVKVSTTEYLKTYYTFKLGDIAFEGHQSKEFRYGRFVENDIGNGIVSHIFAVFRPIQEYDLCFWKYAINNETLMQRILARSTKASTMMHDLVTNDFLKETFLVPSVKEQKQIGAFLNKLDNLITLHQRKLEKLKLVKKSMLEKMFPKNGSSVPEIRFNGFTDDWEQRKVGETVTEVSRPIELNDYQEYQLVTVKRRNEGIVPRGRMYGKNILVKNYFEIHAGDYLISKRQLVHGANGIVPENLDKAVVSNEYMACVSNEFVTAEFLTLLSKTKSLLRDFFLSSYGVDIEKLVFDVEDWEKRSIIIPKIEEQNKICEYFSYLDNLITLHQRKVEKLQIMKKSMLEKMFV